MVNEQEGAGGNKWPVLTMKGNEQRGPLTWMCIGIRFSAVQNQMRLGLSSEVEKCANETQLFRVVKTQADCEEFQKDHSMLGEWATKQEMKLSISQGEGTHIGGKMSKFTYALMGLKI